MTAQVATITGAGGSLGRAVTARLAAPDWPPAFGGRSAARLDLDSAGPLMNSSSTAARFRIARVVPYP